MARNTNTDIIRLGLGHSLILSNLPEAVQVDMLGKMLAEKSFADVGSFGLFESSSPNYTTYYPDVSAEDLKPKEEDFIKPVFRALSMVTVHKRHNPIDFGQNDILRPSMKLLKGQTINVDHETATGNAIGAIADVAWEDEYKSNDGFKIPAGINSVLKIDGKSNPRIVRGIQMDPPSIHSTSVTVEFNWEKSHPKMDTNEFYSKLGTFDDKGVQVRRVVTKVVRYHEISLVNHGADPYAQKINKDGHINNPRYAHITYNSEAEKKIANSFIYLDWKSFGTDDFAAVISNSTIPEETNTEIQNNENSQTMKKELFLSLCAALGLKITLGEDEDPSDAHLAQLQAASNKAKETTEANATALQTANERVTELEEENATLKEASNPDAKELARLKAFENTNLTALKNKVSNAYKQTTATPSQDVLDAISNSNYEGLSVMLATYTAAFEEKVPLKCTKCGSKEVSRGSAKMKDPEEDDDEDNEDDEENQEFKELSNAEVVAKLKAGLSTGADKLHGEA